MRTFKITSLFMLALILTGLPSCLLAAPNLESARITFIQKDVSVANIEVVQVSGSGEVSRRKASLQEAINKNNAVITGAKSRAELQFNDGTIARLGQLTSFTFTPGSRNMNLKEGSGLFQVPKGMGGTRIQAGPITAAITGTTLLLQVFGDRVVLYVYEGSVDLAGQTVRTAQVLTVFNNGKTDLAPFDPAKGVASAALFTKFLDAPSTKTFDAALKVILTALESGNIPDNGDDSTNYATLNDLLRERRNIDETTKFGNPRLGS